MRMQIVYFPYLSMIDYDEIDFGFAKIWNFDRKANEYIQNPVLKERIKKLLSLNVGRTGWELKNIGILSIGQIDFRIFDSNEMVIAAEVRMLTLICGLAKNIGKYRGPNTGHYIMTTENYNMIVQNFSEDSDSVGEHSGVIVSFRNLDDPENMKFYKAPYIPIPLEFSFSEWLHRNLLRLRRKKKILYNRILQATDSFSWSYYNTSDISHSSRILMQTVGFEILFDLPTAGQRKAFKDKIEDLLVRPREKRIRYKYQRQQGSAFILVSESKPLKVMWADRFYNLRNKIIHGGKIKIKDYHFRNQPHYLIAPLFFFLSIKELINEALNKRLFFDGLEIDEVDTGLSMFKGFKYKDQDYLAPELLKIDPNGLYLVPYCK